MQTSECIIGSYSRKFSHMIKILLIIFLFLHIIDDISMNTEKTTQFWKCQLSLFMIYLVLPKLRGIFRIYWDINDFIWNQNLFDMVRQF